MSSNAKTLGDFSLSSSPSSTVSANFRSSDRGDILRLIAQKSESLKQLQTTLLVPLQQLANQLTTQKTIIHEALKHNAEENEQVVIEQQELKQKYLQAIKKVNENNGMLSSHKKVLVRETHSIRNTVKESQAGMDLYRFALQGVEAEIQNEASSKRLTHTHLQRVERAEQLVLMRLSRKRDDLNRLEKEIDNSYQKCSIINRLVDTLSNRAVEGSAGDTGGQTICLDDDKTKSSDEPQTRRRSRNAAESWARRRIFTVTKKLSPDKKKRPTTHKEVKEITSEEVMKQICECLSELMLLDEKLNQLVAVASYSDDVLSPILNLNIKSNDLDIVTGMCMECCSLLQMNADQKRTLFNKLFGNLSPFEYAKLMASKAITAYKILEPNLPIPDVISIFTSEEK
jgi:hypothetical protein